MHRLYDIRSLVAAIPLPSQYTSYIRCILYIFQARQTIAPCYPSDSRGHSLGSISLFSSTCSHSFVTTHLLLQMAAFKDGDGWGKEEGGGGGQQWPRDLFRDVIAGCTHCQVSTCHPIPHHPIPIRRALHRRCRGI